MLCAKNSHGDSIPERLESTHILIPGVESTFFKVPKKKHKRLVIF